MCLLLGSVLCFFCGLTFLPSVCVLCVLACVFNTFLEIICLYFGCGRHYPGLWGHVLSGVQFFVVARCGRHCNRSPSCMLAALASGRTEWTPKRGHGEVRVHSLLGMRATRAQALAGEQLSDRALRLPPKDTRTRHKATADTKHPSLVWCCLPFVGTACLHLLVGGAAFPPLPSFLLVLLSLPLARFFFWR